MKQTVKNKSNDCDRLLGSLFGFGKSLTKLTLNITGCAIKNVTKAVVAVAVKREIVTEMENEYN